MSIPTSKKIKSVSYNGTNIPIEPTYRGFYIDMDVAGTDYGWDEDTSINPDTELYDGVYYSTNGGVSSSYAVMRILFVGYTEFKIYIRSYAEGSYDYTIASTIDAESYPTSYDDDSAYESTYDNQSSGTSIDDYTEVTYECEDEGIHYIYIVYRKDSSEDENDDKGYVLIPYPS